VHSAQVRDTVPDEASRARGQEALAARRDVDYVGIFGSGDRFAPMPSPSSRWSSRRHRRWHSSTSTMIRC
jgi:hypothetical protein